jgi:hypothetical protein
MISALHKVNLSHSLTSRVSQKALISLDANTLYPAMELEYTKDVNNPGISNCSGADAYLESQFISNLTRSRRYALAMADVSSLARKMPPKLAKVPPFPAVAMKILALLSDDSAAFSSIASCIATDPVLSGQLINRANAADLASYCEVRNVLQSLTALGMDRLIRVRVWRPRQMRVPRTCRMARRWVRDWGTAMASSCKAKTPIGH